MYSLILYFTEIRSELSKHSQSENRTNHRGKYVAKVAPKVTKSNKNLTNSSSYKYPSVLHKLNIYG